MRGTVRLHFGIALLFCCVWAGCSESSLDSGAQDSVVPMSGVLEEIDPESWTPRDGLWVLRYPGTSSLLVYGEIRGSKKVGTWIYWYQDGAPMLVASYASDGKPEGNWCAFLPSGEPNCGGTRLRESDGGWGFYSPGIGDVDWMQFDPEFRAYSRDLFPAPWPGCGHYVNGVRNTISGEDRDRLLWRARAMMATLRLEHQ